MRRRSAALFAGSTLLNEKRNGHARIAGLGYAR